MNLDKYPKSITKAVRYIKQDAKKEQLEEQREILNNAIKQRNVKFNLK